MKKSSSTFCAIVFKATCRGVESVMVIGRVCRVTKFCSIAPELCLSSQALKMDG